MISTSESESRLTSGSAHLARCWQHSEEADSAPAQPTRTRSHRPELSLSAAKLQANSAGELGCAYSSFSLESAKNRGQAAAIVCPSLHVQVHLKLQCPPTSAAKSWIERFVASQSMCDELDLNQMLRGQKYLFEVKSL